MFFTLFLSNPGNFFAAGNSNYLEGVETAFGPDSLTTAKTLFRKQKVAPGTKTKDQKPINVRPKYVVVPVEIETDAELLMGSVQLMIDASGTKTKIPVDNRWDRLLLNAESPNDLTVLIARFAIPSTRPRWPQQVRSRADAAPVGHVLQRIERQGVVSVRRPRAAAGV